MRLRHYWDSVKFVVALYPYNEKIFMSSSIARRIFLQQTIHLLGLGGTHRYFFKLYALDRTLELPSGATKAQLEAAMNSHILAAAELIGLYSRQK